MIKTLKELDPKKAAGVLARAALSLGYETKADNQITDLLREVRDQLGIEKDDQSLESTDRIAQFLVFPSSRGPLRHFPARAGTSAVASRARRGRSGNAGRALPGRHRAPDEICRLLPHQHSGATVNGGCQLSSPA